MAQKKSHFKMIMNRCMRKSLCQELSHHVGIVMAQVKWRMAVSAGHIVVASVYVVHGVIMSVIVGCVKYYYTCIICLKML